jgi:predicted ATP-grasp superfamily ATP-dependent carboligase
MILERYAALLDRVTVLERALDKIGILVADEQAQADPRGALRVVSSMVDRALDG